MPYEYGQIAQAKRSRDLNRLSTLGKWPTCLRRRGFGLPTARAPVYHLPGQQGLKISIANFPSLFIPPFHHATN